MKTMKTMCLAGLAATLSLGSAQAATLIPVPAVPGSVWTAASAINDNNVVTGTYTTSDGAYHGFIGTLDGNYTTFDTFTGDTEGRGINNAGVVIGIANLGSGGDVPIERFPDGTIEEVSKDGAPFAHGIAGGINKRGFFVATGDDQNYTAFGFYGRNAAYVQDVPGFASANPRGINDYKDVVGFYYGGDGVLHGLVLRAGTTSTLDYPDPSSTGTQLYGINNSGVIDGVWFGSKGQIHAFIYNPSTNQFTPLERKHVNGGQFAQVIGGINNDGLVAVNFYRAGGSFIYCPHKPSKCPAGGTAIAASDPVPAQPVFHFDHRSPLNVDPDKVIRFRSGADRLFR